jgi:hypothetical protein
LSYGSSWLYVLIYRARLNKELLFDLLALKIFEKMAETDIKSINEPNPYFC